MQVLFGRIFKLLIRNRFYSRLLLSNKEYTYVKCSIFYTNGLFSFSNESVYACEKPIFV